LSRRVASAGRIAPGYKADIVMLDLDHSNWLPFNDPVNQLVRTEATARGRGCSSQTH
jgi:cytosine/adenosine deaminase-related metal-dependent hydrolase